MLHRTLFCSGVQAACLSHCSSYKNIDEQAGKGFAIRGVRTRACRRGLVCWMDMKTLRWIHSSDSSAAGVFLAVTVSLACAVWTGPGLAQSQVSDRIERAKAARDRQEYSVKSNEYGRGLPRTALDRRIDDDAAASADRHWRSILAVQQRERAVQSGVRRGREIRGLVETRARRATALSGKIRRHGIEQRSGMRR